jgi:hypothetical protein
MSVGASGAIWGLMTAGIAVALRPRGLLPEATLKGIRRGLWQPLAVNLLYSLQPGIDMLAHLGGGATGFALTWTLLTRDLVPLEQRSSPSEAEATTAVALTRASALVGVAMLLSMMVALAAGRPWELVAPPTFQRIAVGDTGVTVELPGAPVTAPKLEERNGARFYYFGKFAADPVVFEIAVFHLGREATSAEVAALVARERESMDNARPEHVSKQGKAESLDLGGHPALRIRRELKSGVRTISYLVVVGTREVLLTAYARAERPAGWVGIEERVAASLAAR